MARGPLARLPWARLRPGASRGAADRHREYSPRDRPAERGRHLERQAGADRALGVIEEAPPRLVVAFEMRIGDPRLAEDRAVAFHREDERDTRARGPDRFVRHAG